MKVSVNAVTASRVLTELMKLKRATDGLKALKDEVNTTIVGLVEASITDPLYDPTRLGGMDLDSISEGYVTLRMVDEEVEVGVDPKSE